MSTAAAAIIADVRSLLAGDPVFLAGSLVAEHTYNKTDAHSDVDIFAPTGNVLVSAVQKMLDNGYTIDDRFVRVWERWLRMGFKTWHTNSLRLHSPGGIETNVVYKLWHGHPTTTLSQVLESFDFGLLGTGYDLESNRYHDMRPYLFPGMDPDGPLPMMPWKRSDWRRGLISQYNGLREAGRYAKYHAYGYDLSLVKDDLATGYYEAYLYHADHFDEGKRTLGQIYSVIAHHIENDLIDELSAWAKTIDYKDSLDTIMEALE